MKTIKLIMLLLVAVLFLNGCSAVLDKYNGPVDSTNSEEIIFEVPSGASTAGIAEDLQAAGLIQNANSFKLKAREMGVDGQMKAGQYKLSPSMDVASIIEKLVDGDIFEETVHFTIPEGYEVRQIIELLVEAKIVDREIFIDVLENGEFDYAFLEGIDRTKRLEGYLFPDTYEFALGADEYHIVNRMLQRFSEVFTEDYVAQSEVLGMSVDEVVTLASIIEREARVAEEFPIISSVFHNRIETGMALQSCATVQFVLGERKDRLTYADLEIESPFNTYIYSGLTPSPIASPGQLALESALYPAETNYLYFATTEKNDGTHYFNETLAGHNRDAEKGKNP